MKLFLQLTSDQKTSFKKVATFGLKFPKWLQLQEIEFSNQVMESLAWFQFSFGPNWLLGHNFNSFHVIHSPSPPPTHMVFSQLLFLILSPLSYSWLQGLCWKPSGVK